ncbi:MAG: ATP-dependent protease LonB [Euryarchaeota archaeon]|jgi:Lon-like ATP-dependent protease|uniref:Archaeal Lon protease n=2 Tax=environmental samples TaxID=68359 RepID=A0A075FU16_9EURY|nr:ATP-dependent protease, putative (lonB) [uncultured marine group II/III euryarchaeote AD1000_44_A01]AIE95160.1 ATP-dependent protease, putative (lonB) [uncultured marine group II/III euryarchaeote AD1000_58_G05]MAJ18927.1 ATP-dependent protease LonB [Euryarchaeota archaeon]MDC0045850.1 ATP-dependent protease LonB [Candidatus Poseidoniales archaeon]MDC0149761.1 ATP-dependent protease LonB [Candidatus Poseidoniales archaeon]|tara:strand:- start:9391 stop:11421 length:2031 start_codon:yes stop_codon:yes gene_type:complete
MSDEQKLDDPLESWEDGAAFGVASSKDPICKTPVEEWSDALDIVSTEEVPIPDKLVDQVIGQEAASIIVRKAAEQRRHIIMVGEPGTGKSMLSRSMTEFLPKEQLEDILVYRNHEDENEPRIRTVPAGRGSSIISERRAHIKQQRERTNRTLLFIALVVGAALLLATISSGEILTFIFGSFLLVFGYFFLRTRMTSGDEGNIPKLLVKHDRNEEVPFIDATGTLAGALLGDVRHDPFQSGADLATPAHERVEPGAVHRANKGVLYIDEIRMLRMEEQQALLVAMQEKALSISGRSERSSGALTKSEPVPTDFILVAAGNLDSIQNMHPALRSRIRGYGYEVYVNTDMRDTELNRRRLVRFVAQEVRNEQSKDSGKAIPHFSPKAVGLILKEAQRRSGRRGKLSLRLRELGGLVRIAGDLAAEENASLVEPVHVTRARMIAKPLEQQVADRYLERQSEYAMLVNRGERIGRVNGLAVLGADTGLSDYSGVVLPVEAMVTPTQGRSGKVIATGGLSDLAQESVTNISAVVKKLTGKDIQDYDLHVQFPGTHNVDGDSASITMATAIISAFEGVPIDQNLAMTGSLSVRGEVLPIGGVSAKIEAAVKSGIERVIIPRSNQQDVLIDEKYESQVEIIPVDSLDEVLQHALVGAEEKVSLVERLANVVDTISSGPDSQPSA